MATRELVRARVTRIDVAGAAWITSPELGQGQEMGPCDVADGQAVAVNDQVIVAPVDGVADNVVIVGVLRQAAAGAPPTGHIHDDRYYTETEMTALLAEKVNTAPIAPKPATDRPETYPTGYSAMELATEAGWPEQFGTVFTNNTGNVNRVSQIYVAKNTSRMYTRSADNAQTDGWRPWREVSMSDHLHDDRYQRSVALGALSGTGQYVRLGVIDGANASNGGNLTLMVASTGAFGTMGRYVDVVTLSQRGDNLYKFEGTRQGSGASPWVYYVKQISTYVFELWAQRPTFDAALGVAFLGGWRSTFTVDSTTSTLPAGLVQQSAPVTIDRPDLKVDRISQGAAASPSYIRRVRDLAVWSETVNNGTGDLVIQTNQTFGNFMSRLDIKGYIYSGGNNLIDLSVGYYAYSNAGVPTFVNYTAIDRGNVPISQVRLMRRTSDNTVVIVLTPGLGDWDYPKITIDGMFAHTGMADSQYEGWTISRQTSLAAYTAMVTVPLNPAFNSVIRVVHGTNAATPRPDAYAVDWFGSVAPTNMNSTTDTWFNTAL